MIDYETHRFKTSEVAEAAGMKPVTLRAHYARGNFRTIGVRARKDADRDGMPHLHNLRSALHLALAAELISAGVDAAQAFEAAIPFAYVGDGQRDPAGLFALRHVGETYFLCWPSAKKSDLISGDRMAQSPEYALHLHKDGADYIGPVIVVSVRPIEQRVFASLGIEGNSWERPDGWEPDDGDGEFLG